MASADCYKGFWMLNLKFLKLLVLPLQCELGFFSRCSHWSLCIGGISS